MLQTSSQPDWPVSLWRQTETLTPPNPVLTSLVETDVTIIGAGLTGVSSALFLSEAGLNVTVLDAKDVGWGASGRSGGQVNPMLPFNSVERVRKLVGDAFFEKITHASLNSADDLFALIRKYQIRCGARQTGWLRVLHSNRARKSAETDVASWNRYGADMQIIDGAEVKRLSGTNHYKTGVVTPRGGAVQPYELTCGLARAAESAGAHFYGQSPVLKIERSGEAWVCTTPQGSVTSSWVLIATNGYTKDVVPGLANTIIPMNPIQVATEPLDKSIADTILPEGHTISDSRRIIMYARREPDNRLVYGGLGRKKPDGTLTGFDWLKRDAVSVFPQLSGVRWTYEWGGTIAITGDHLPHIHQPKQNMLIGLGYNGRGVAMSVVVGRSLAERVLGKGTSDLPLPLTDIKPFPFRSAKLAGMGTAIWLMRLLDRIESR
ncbi:NAD(P)/FAD-dependent oxidoreductase [Roseibium sp.]|uniref:NAD(P)/FAD-dependent oxidoreductase n=1 Tax=Roseibium sp. TaxID=1936156 RepID=UPI003B5034E8